MASKRDAVFDYETLKRVLLTPAVRTLHICSMYFREDRSAPEIAKKTGMTEAAVRKVIARARKKLSSTGTKRSRFDVFSTK